MNSKRIIPVFFILILSLFPIHPFVESAEYGEENENLGQFTDDYENDDNVSVAVNVINNQTLDCMELEYSDEVKEDFTSYIEVDEDADITRTSNLISWVTMREDANSYVWKDFGGGYFGDFEHRFTLNLTDVEAGDASSPIIMGYSVMADIPAKIDTLQATNWLGVFISQWGSTDDTYNVGMRERRLGGNVFNVFATFNYLVNTAYYITFNRSGNNVGLYVYDDEARTSLVASTTGVGNGNTYRYLHALSNKGQAGDAADHTTGKLSDYFIGVTGYLIDGYFITEDYLNYTTGQGLALLTNASIPYGTSMTVQFSNDHVTWVDNEGNVGSTPVLDGFYAIDLRDLNYMDSFKMYNLTTTDSAITPRLFQSRLITTNGTAGVGPGPTVIQNVTGEWFYYNLTTINVTVGTHDSGDLNSTLDIDGDTYNCSEVVGAPGYVIEFEWTDVDQDAHCLWVTAYIFYDGVSAHTINVDLWNFTSTAWVTIGIIYDMVDFEWVNSSIYDLRMPNDFINSTGAVRGRFYHASAGNINDDIHVDFLKLYAFIPSDVVTPIISEDNFFWIFIAITLSMIVGIVVWLKYEHNNN